MYINIVIMKDSPDSISTNSERFPDFLWFIPFGVHLYDHLGKDFLLGALIRDFDSVILKSLTDSISMASELLCEFVGGFALLVLHDNCSSFCVG